MEKTKIVYWAQDKVEADLIQGMLKEYGIPCRQLQESFGEMNSLQFGIFGQIALAVDESRVPEAEALLSDMDNPDDKSEKESKA